MSDLFAFVSEREQMESLRSLITHPAWTGFFVKNLREARDRAVSMLVNPALSRQSEMSDDFLRARIMTLEELFNLGPTVLLEWEHAQVEQQSQAEYTNGLQERAELGQMAPLSDR
jgi:hypothetical protein